MAAPECHPGQEGNQHQTQQLGSQQMLSHSLKALPALSPGTGTATPPRTLHLLSCSSKCSACTWLIWEVNSWDWLWEFLCGCQGSTQGQRHSTPHPPHPTWRWELSLPRIPCKSFPGPPSKCAMLLSQSPVTGQLCPVLEVP